MVINIIKIIIHCLLTDSSIVINRSQYTSYEQSQVQTFFLENEFHKLILRNLFITRQKTTLNKIYSRFGYNYLRYSRVMFTYVKSTNQPIHICFIFSLLSHIENNNTHRVTNFSNMYFSQIHTYHKYLLYLQHKQQTLYITAEAIGTIFFFILFPLLLP